MEASNVRPAPPKLRSADNRLKVLNQSPSSQHMEISGFRLPTYEQVLLCYMAFMKIKRAEEPSGKVTRVVSKLVVEEVVDHYKKANIATKNEKKCAEAIEKLNKEYININKKKNPQRIEEFRQKLKITMPFWPRGTLETMEKKLLDNLTPTFEKERLEEDIAFLKSMVGNREATYASADIKKQIKDVNTYQKSAKRKASIEIQKVKLGESSRNLVDCEDLTEPSESDSDQGDKDYTLVPSTKKKRKVKVGTTITLPHDVLQSRNLVSTSVRNKVSPTALAGIVGALIEDTGGDKKAVNLSYSMSYKYRLQATNCIAQEIKENWKPPHKGILHWDGKLMETLDGIGKEERLPVLISGKVITLFPFISVKNKP